MKIVAAVLVAMAVGCGGSLNPVDFGGTWDWTTSSASGLLVLVPSHDGRMQGFFSNSDGTSGILTGQHSDRKFEILLGHYRNLEMDANAIDDDHLNGSYTGLPFEAVRRR